MTEQPLGLSKVFPGLARSTTANDRARFNRSLEKASVDKLVSKKKNSLAIGQVKIDNSHNVEVASKGKSLARLNSEAYTDFTKAVKKQNEAAVNISLNIAGNLQASTDNKTARHGHTVEEAIAKKGKFASVADGAHPKENKSDPAVQNIAKENNPIQQESSLGFAGKVRVLNIKHKDFDANNFTGNERVVLKVATLLENFPPNYIAEFKEKRAEQAENNETVFEKIKSNNGRSEEAHAKRKANGLAKGHELEAANLNVAKFLGEKFESKPVPKGSGYAERQDAKMQVLKDQGLLV